eukprot:4519061-Prymnesium_polylepis.1
MSLNVFFLRGCVVRALRGVCVCHAVPVYSGKSPVAGAAHPKLVDLYRFVLRQEASRLWRSRLRANDSSVRPGGGSGRSNITNP